jgi:hypothetical protein
MQILGATVESNVEISVMLMMNRKCPATKERRRTLRSGAKVSKVLSMFLFFVKRLIETVRAKYELCTVTMNAKTVVSV